MDRWSKEDGPPGAWVFRLLAGRWTIRLLRELTGGPLQPSDLEQRMPGAAHSAVMRGLQDLVLAGGVARRRVAGVPPRAYYELADGSRTLLAVAQAAEEWERRWASPGRPDVPGRWTVRLLADRGNRTLLGALAGDSLRPIDVDGRVSQLSRSATRRRVGHLHASGLLARTCVEGEVRYALTAAARLLAPIDALAAHWEVGAGTPFPIGEGAAVLKSQPLALLHNGGEACP